MFELVVKLYDGFDCCCDEVGVGYDGWFEEGEVEKCYDVEYDWYGLLG